jgi:hypothetical protein
MTATVSVGMRLIWVGEEHWTEFGGDNGLKPFYISWNNR